MMKILKQVYIGLGNSFFELAWWGQHPLIDSAETNGWYAVSKKASGRIILTNNKLVQGG